MIRHDEGMGMIEVLVAMAIAVVALVALHQTLDKGTRSSLGGERQVAALAIAEREIEQARQVVARYGIDGLALSSAPTVPTGSFDRDPAAPGAFLDTSTGVLRFRTMRSFHDTSSDVVATEPLRVDAVNGRLAPVTSGATSGPLTADVHRFVTERTELCVTGGNCANQSRRLTVAVVARLPGSSAAGHPDGERAVLPVKPVYLTTIINAAVPNDRAAAAGYGLRVGVDLP